MASKNSWAPSRQLMRSWEQSQKSCRALGPPQAQPTLLPIPFNQAQHLPLSEQLLPIGQDERPQSCLRTGCHSWSQRMWDPKGQQLG